MTDLSLSTLKAKLLSPPSNSDEIPGPPVPMMIWPFDHDSTDAEIEAVLTHSIGETITWHNAAGSHIATLIRFRRVIRHPVGGTYVDVLCNPCGFRAIYVDQIDSIG